LTGQAVLGKNLGNALGESLGDVSFSQVLVIRVDGVLVVFNDAVVKTIVKGAGGHGPGLGG